MSYIRYTGFLDFAPKAVDATKSTATSIRATAGNVVSSTMRLGGSLLNKTGIPSLLGGVAGVAKWGAASLIEEVCVFMPNFRAASKKWIAIPHLVRLV